MLSKNLEKILKDSKKIFVTSLIGISLVCGCGGGDNPTSSNNNEDDVKQHIVDQYYAWAAESRDHDYNGMMALVMPGSNMAGATNLCKSEWDQDHEFCYAFSGVHVDLLTEDPADSWVMGNYIHYQEFCEPFYGGFYGGAQPFDGNFWGFDWKLNQMNWNCGWNWWE